MYKSVATEAPEYIVLKTATVAAVPTLVTVNPAGLQTLELLPVDWETSLPTTSEVTIPV